jgi:phosphocarrier protein HPr
MVQRKATITNKLGLHLRAAAQLVQVASAFKSDVRVRRKNVEVDAKSIMGVLGLEGAIGAELDVIASGPDEDKALAAVIELIENKFNEGE